MGQDDKPFNLFEYANNHFRDIVMREMRIYAAQLFVEAAVPYHPEEKKIATGRIERLQNLLWRADISKFRYAEMHRVLAEQVFKDGDMMDFLFSLAASFRATITAGTYEALIKEHLLGMFTPLPLPMDAARRLRFGPQPFLDGLDRKENTEPEVLLVNDWLTMLVLLRINFDLIFQLFAEQQAAKIAAAKEPPGRRGTTA